MTHEIFALIPAAGSELIGLLIFCVLPAILAFTLLKEEKTGARIAAAAISFFFSWLGFAVVYLFFYFQRNKK